ncbi:type I phosphomannose isomerase catalytic subunit [Meiothermus sp. QL-1]|uniref:type I phosphomannose isomerase catalytic subunit n=1 Tax=Meiothermus sp. QL-1 TaxID=2058095 RepID=UPI001F36C84F|nr:type I phosphomannose isomerase catalytic subunit [Meiothermus sp. QL-1]
MPRVWGGRTLAQRLGLDCAEPVGEVWLAYDENLIRTGPLAGIPLAEALKMLGPRFIGRVPYEKYGLELPLLVKFLDAAEWLSVQVHPDDAYAHTNEAGSGFHGKTEAWYVLAGEGEVVYGLREPLEQDTLRRAAEDGSIWDLLRRERVGPGQVVGVPAGTIHAIGPGLLLYEVQQRSDLTYRLYDYGRPRELHLEKALAVACLEPTPLVRPTPLPGHQKEVLLAAEAFVLERHFLQGRRSFKAPETSFLLLTLVEGGAAWAEGPLGWGDTLLVGAGEQVEVAGEGIFLAAFMPSPEVLAACPPGLRM